jgi:GT2 family glycosyltransferase
MSTANNKNNMENTENRIKLVVGFITYDEVTYKYLPFFLASLKEQCFKDFIIISSDNTEEASNKNRDFINSRFPEIDLEWSGGNIGFAKANNRMISKAITLGAKYILLLNPDMILRKDAIEILIKAMEDDRALGSVSPKVLHWDFNNNIKTKLIDTCGIILGKGLRFMDQGQAQPDNGQFDENPILGPSGCASFFRIESMEETAYHINENIQYYDELMFMYKEDCDIAYRLHLSGFKSKFIPDAIFYHDRTVEARGESNISVAFNRKNKSRNVKKWSFLNQQIIFSKFFQYQTLKNKFSIIFYQLKMIIFILVFEQYLFKEFIALNAMKPEIKEKKKFKFRFDKN